MSDPPELDDLARRYLDLWQDQLAGLADDDEVAKVMARTLELMTTGATALAYTPRADADDRAKPEDGTQAAPPARGGADPDLAELAGRVGALEKRITALEAGTGRPGGGVKGKPKRRRS